MGTAAVRKKDPLNILALYEPYFQNSISLLFKAKKGLKPDAVFDFIYVSGLANAAIETVLNKSMKTFQNYLDRNTLLDAVTSEKLLRLFALYSKGAILFGSLEAFGEWLSKPAHGFGNEIPQSMLDTMTGIGLVNEELVRIEYGDLA